MKLKHRHRCPWCGEIVDKPNRHFFDPKYVFRCSSCGHRYQTRKWSALQKIYISAFILFFPFMIFAAITAERLIYIYLVMLLFICIPLEKLTPYERYDDDVKFTIKKYKARLSMDGKLSIIRRKILLMDKSVIPICFIGENGEPVSHVICISLEDTVKTAPTEFECIFSFLPLSPVSYDMSESTEFLLFDEERNTVGKGNITSEHDGFA